MPAPDAGRMTGGAPLPVATQGTVPRPFDGVAADYDARFTDQVLGRWLRETVWERLGAAFAAGDHVLELGCGTGEDAIWLARRGVRVTATDIAAEMLAVASRKAAAAGLSDRITFRRFDFAGQDPRSPMEDAEDSRYRGFVDPPDRRPTADDRRPANPPEPAIPGGGALFDGAFSNFGALNCIGDRRSLAQRLAASLRPGASVVLVLMGRLCPWEIAWHLAVGQPRKAVRRFRPGRPAHVGAGASLRVWYPTPRRLRSELRPWFRDVDTFGIGLLLPPSYLGSLVDRAPRCFAALRTLDGRIAPFSASLSDHYLAVFERR